MFAKNKNSEKWNQLVFLKFEKIAENGRYNCVSQVQVEKPQVRTEATVVIKIADFWDKNMLTYLKMKPI